MIDEATAKQVVNQLHEIADRLGLLTVGNAFGEDIDIDVLRIENPGMDLDNLVMLAAHNAGYYWDKARKNNEL